MRAPRSYTAEDVVEVHGHGGDINMRRLLEAICDAGASPAAPGEFTQRAFLNGRLDLTQAEAVSDIIHASSDAALSLAQSHLNGSLGSAIVEIQESLTIATTLTEAAIDFSTEEHVYQLDTKALLERLSRLIDTSRQMLGSFDAGRQLRDGVRVVILGRPNAGKSTLFNLLCGHQRAIVTPTPGTTRDFLEELIIIDGVALRLIDTAGLRQTEDNVEAIGIDRAYEQARQADLIIWLLDGTDPQPLSDDEVRVFTDLSATILPIFNKSDLPSLLPPETTSAVSKTTQIAALSTALTNSIRTPSALVDAIARIARLRLRPAAEGAVITRQRHRDALKTAIVAMERARDATLDDMSLEFVALDLRLALEATGRIVGHVSTDDILARIFSEFCVGK